MCSQVCKGTGRRLTHLRILRKLLELVLHHNVFQFNGITYRQKHGTAMGTSLAPPFAILYMASLEEPFIQSRTLKPLLYKRYIDDVFMIWQHGIEELRLFIRDFNQLRPRIQLTFESSSTEINFLDTTVYKGSRHSNKGYLDIKPYFKSTNSMNYLHFSSTHPRSVFKGIVVGETTRFLRNSSNATTFENTIAKFKQALKLRGYPHNFVDKHIRNVNFVDRTSLLMNKPRTQMTRPIMVHCYHPQDGEIRNIISNHMNILRREPIIAARFPDLPLMSHTVGKTTHQFLIRASLPTSLVENNNRTPGVPQPLLTFKELPPNNTRCTYYGCGTCSMMSDTQAVISTTRHKTFRIRGNFTCRSTHVVYCITCKKCRKQYVGQTGGTLCFRMMKHRNKMSEKMNRPLYKHYAMAGHIFQDVTLTALEYVPDLRSRLQAESKWIKELDTMIPRGLNYIP